MNYLETNRLVLRQWLDSDAPQFAKLNANPEVMKYFPKTLDRLESDAAIDRYKSVIARQGWGFWAAELKGSNEFIGFIGLNQLPEDHPLAPTVEIGWRLLPQHWGLGLASEGAAACLGYAFENLYLSEVISQTPLQNKPSERVMIKIGMTDSRQNFPHPSLASEHPLSIHLLYRVKSNDYNSIRHTKDG